MDGMGMSVQRSQLTEYHVHTLGVVTGGVVSLRQVFVLSSAVLVLSSSCVVFVL